MNREDIIRMAREAGLFVPQAGIPENGALMRFAALVAAFEREACAKECEIEASVIVTNASEEYQEGRSMGATVCYHAIRARSKS